MDHAHMTARPVQVSMDTALLERIDADPEVKRQGRSAFIREAVLFYLQARARREIDRQIRGAFEGEADAMRAEVAELMEDQTWPDG